MQMVLSNGFCEMTKEERYIVSGGGVVAFVYAMGFVFGCTPLGFCIAAGVGLVALGVGIYCGVKGI